MIKMTQQKQKNTTREIIRLAMPMALQSVLASSVQLVDNLYIGRMSAAQNVANALNAVNNITFILSTLITGFIAGIGVYFAQASGRKDVEEQKNFFKVKIIWALVLSGILLTTVFIFLKPIASLWISGNDGSEKSKTLEEVTNYGSIIIPTLLIDYLVICFSSSFKENKKNWITMWIAIIALVFNASLNYPFIYTLGLGVKGSAITTLMARVVELILWISFLLIKKPDFLPRLCELFKIKSQKIFVVFKKSAWWSINGLLGTLAFTLQIMFLSRVSQEAGASLNSAGVVAQIIYAFSGGFSAAISIVIMHKIGSGDVNDIKTFTRRLSLFSFGVGVILGIMLGAISPLMSVIYPNYSNYVQFQSMVMLWAIGVMIPFNLFLTSYLTVVKGFGYAKILIVLDSLIAWIVTVPLTILLTSPYVFDSNFLHKFDYGVIYLFVSLIGVAKIPIVLHFFSVKIKPTEYKQLF